MCISSFWAHGQKQRLRVDCQLVFSEGSLASLVMQPSLCGIPWVENAERLVKKYTLRVSYNSHFAFPSLQAFCGVCRSWVRAYADIELWAHFIGSAVFL